MIDEPKHANVGLPEPDAAEECWLIEDVVPVYDAIQEDPGRALSAEDVFGSIRKMHAERLRDEKIVALRTVLDEASASGVSERSATEIMIAARQEARTKGLEIPSIADGDEL
jgi:hypothetical protein